MMSRFLPLILFVMLGVLLAVGLKIADKKTHIPSPLIGKAVPEFTLPVLHELDRTVTQEDFLGQPYLLNFWGSWCPTCVFEHPVITDFARTRQLRIVGVNFRDEPADAEAWLVKHGDPYDIHVHDYDGRMAIDFGVYAAPESFLIDPSGKVVYKHIGALTWDAINETILPMVRNMERSGT